jgi:hypothetical protein
MHWTKLGRVYVPDRSRSWMTSQAHLPTPHALDEDTVRIYAAFRDQEGVGRIGFVDVAASDPLHILRVSERPALDVGGIGAFDEHGVTPGCVVRHGKTLRLYYFGWQRAIKVPYLSFAGLAVSEDGGATFERATRAPVLSRLDGERICRSAPFVGHHGGLWRAWYVAADTWTELEGRLVPACEIRCVSSQDGVRWKGGGETAVAPTSEEAGVGRPFVQASGDGYRMWYSICSRSRRHRIGYATSEDGASWTRRDEEVGIDVSSSGWDSEVVCFGAVLATRAATYLFYNGSRYGETGFGAALLDEG